MINVAVLMGRLVADPELRHTPNNIAVTRFRIAVDRRSNSGGERQADFIDITAWRNTAEFVCRYFKKGQMIAVNGSIQTGNYTDNNGVKRNTFEIVADNVSFTESKKSSGGGDFSDEMGRPFNNPPQYNEPAPAYSSGANEDFEEVVGDDDLPF